MHSGKNNKYEGVGEISNLIIIAKYFSITCVGSAQYVRNTMR